MHLPVADRGLAVDDDPGFVESFLDSAQTVEPATVVVADGEGVGTTLRGDEDALFDQFRRRFGARRDGREEVLVRADGATDAVQVGPFEFLPRRVAALTCRAIIIVGDGMTSLKQFSGWRSVS